MARAPEKVCPVCSGRLPELAGTGRPRLYCSGLCTERARVRRKRAAALLEFADRVEECVGRPGFGSEAHLRGRATELRTEALEELASIGEGD
jgi:hypothetical protein